MTRPSLRARTAVPRRKAGTTETARNALPTGKTETARDAAKAGKALPSDALLDAAARQFRALSEPARLKVLRRLMAGDATVGDLALELGSSQANASKHVAVLAAVGFVARRKDGPSVICSIGDPVARELCSLMCERAVTRAKADLRGVTD